jgi:hypothetical protein
MRTLRNQVDAARQDEESKSEFEIKWNDPAKAMQRPSASRSVRPELWVVMDSHSGAVLGIRVCLPEDILT